MEEGKYTKEYKKDKNFPNLRYFKLEVLDRYKNNPIYLIEEGGVSLFISIKDEYYNNSSIEDDDKILIQSLGYAYRKENNSKFVVTYLVYLKDLPKKQQDYWASCEVEGEFLLDNDFFNQEFQAEFTDRVNIFDAFLQEIFEINKICSIEERPPLFNYNYKNEKPTEFSWATKETLNSYNTLIHLFDKFVSENINKDFFKGKIELEEEKTREDGKVLIIQKGTLRLLEEFLDKYFKTPTPEPKTKMIKHFKDVREKRQSPAHKVNKDVYDPKYKEEIKKLVIESYISIRTLRLIFMNFPKARIDYNPPEWLQKGKIM